MEERTAHNESLAEYECEIKDLEKNLSDAIIANAGEPMVSYEPKFVHQQIRDNQVMLYYYALYIIIVAFVIVKKENRYHCNKYV